MSQPLTQPDSKPESVHFKLVLLGEAAVGKSSLITRFTKNKYEENRESTIGAAFMSHQVPLPSQNVIVKFEIWDTAGQERYKSLTPMYYRNANAAVVVFDLTNKNSLERAKQWVTMLREQIDGICIALAGNKCDLPKVIDETEIKEYANEFNLFYFECSAKTGENVNDIFIKLAENMPVQQQLQKRRDQERETVDLVNKQSQPSQCGC